MPLNPRRKMKIKNVLLVLATMMAFAWSVLEAQITPVDRVKPDYPQAMLDNFEEGKAVIRVTIGEDGTVTECSISSATDPRFGEAAMAAARKWTFKPIIEGGRAVSKKVNIPFNFTLPPEAKANKNFGRAVFKDLDPQYKQVEAKSLPQRLQPLNPAKPRYPEALKGTGKTASVRIRYTIDVDGQTINPQVVSQDIDPEFIRPALLAVIISKYLPSTQDGRLVYVTTQRTFNFEEGMNEMEN